MELRRKRPCACKAEYRVDFKTSTGKVIETYLAPDFMIIQDLEAQEALTYEIPGELERLLAKHSTE